MADTKSNPDAERSDGEFQASDAIQPSWKPLLWTGGVLLALIVLWEVFLELGMNLIELIFEILEKVWLILIEAPEEFLEDVLADWLKHHFPHEAERYSEITTAIGLTPLKILLIIVLGRWAWRRTRADLWPRMRRWFHVRVLETRLAWGELGWPYRILGGLVILGILVVLI